MGTPDNWMSTDETILIYTWSEEKGVIITGLLSCEASPHIQPTLIETTTYMYIFDEEGIFKKLDITIERGIE
jgi:hypothetical protein